MYLDLIVIFNFLMNIIIMYSVAILLKRYIRVKYIIIASILGIIPTLIYLINDILIINMLLVLIFSLIMSIIAFKYNNIIYTIKNILYMYLSSVFLGGSLYLFDVRINNMLMEFLLLIFISFLVMKIYSRMIINLKNNNANYYKVDIYYHDEIISCMGFLDTGNKIIDPYNGYPVILLSCSKLKQCIDKYILVPYYTVSSSSILKCFRPDRVDINGNMCKSKCLVALMDTNINIDYDLILHSKLLERI